MVEHTLYNYLVYNVHYSCANFTQEMLDDPKKGNVLFGTFFMFISFIYLCIASLVLMAMLHERHRSFNGFRIMAAIGVCDVVNLMVMGIYTGYLMSTGNVYCSNVLESYLVGCFCMAFYCLTCVLTVILAINRCLAIAHPPTQEMLFNGYKTFIWIFCAVSYALYLFMFTNPIFFNAWGQCYFFNPYYGYNFKITDKYYNASHYFTNLLVGFLLLIIYSIFAIFLIHQTKIKSKIAFKSTGDYTKSIFATVFLNSLLILASSVGYLYVQYVSVPNWYYLVSSTLAISVQGFNSIFYICFNNTIRETIAEYGILNLKPKKFSTMIQVSTKIG
uniref:G_PROTEIN_RECEP_F1_2 domain-containing protein n=1 Tax=Rhabditophanes sp. KR3021 TaxID=114890 RepID=A0AC35UCP3_9BILA